LPTVCGILTTIGVGVLLRRLLPLRNLSVAEEHAFVMFVTYGLAYSLLAAAATVVRRRDAVILILAATIIWGVFVETERTGMVRFLIFAALVTIGILGSLRVASPTRTSLRIVSGALVPAILCGLGGLIVYGLALGGRLPAGLSGSLLGGFVWGFALGVAVGIGVTTGVEVIRWRSEAARS